MSNNTKENIIKEILENQFIEDYNTINNYMNNINIILEEEKVDKYTYDIFCIKFEKLVLEYYKKNNYNIKTLTPEILSDILNFMIIDKVMKYFNMTIEDFNETDDNGRYKELIKKLKYLNNKYYIIS